jgi:putative nucleotidyltransferase with HDIG domain
MMHAEDKKPPYEPIDVASLSSDTVVPFDLYLRLDESGQYVLFRGFNLPFKEEHRRRLTTNEVDRLYIDSSDQDKYRRYVEDTLARILASSTATAKKKAAILYASAACLMQEVLADPARAENIRRGARLARDISRFLSQDAHAFNEIRNAASRTYHTHTHSIHVCALATALAARMGCADANELEGCATGALLHDIGKSRIDPRILSKKGPLDEDEWNLVKKHPEWGVDLLREAEGISDAARTICLQHHEKLDGTGYPYGLTRDHIHPFARISCIADAFDALTSNRPFREAVDAASALRIMKREMSRKVDKKALKELRYLVTE